MAALTPGEREWALYRAVNIVNAERVRQEQMRSQWLGKQTDVSELKRIVEVLLEMERECTKEGRARLARRRKRDFPPS